MCRRSTRQRKDVDYSEANALVSLDDVKTRGSKLENVSWCLLAGHSDFRHLSLHASSCTHADLYADCVRAAQGPQVHADYHPVESREEDVVQSSVDPSEGTRDELGRLVFDDAPDFRPTLTPKQVIQAGSFGGYDLMLCLASFVGSICLP